MFVLRLSCSKWKKNVSLLPEKNNNFFLYLFNAFFSFFFSSEKNKFAFCLALKEKSNNNFFYLFLLFFFCFPNDDNWWQVGRWYGITNLVMTWWLGWVVVTKWSKCWWHHIGMVPYSSFEKILLPLPDSIFLLIGWFISFPPFRVFSLSNFFFFQKTT